MNAVKKLFVLTSAMAALSASGLAAANSPATGELHVTIRIMPVCKVVTNTGNAPSQLANPPSAGADIDFGEYPSSHNTEVQGLSKAGATNGISVTCTKGTPYTISLTPSNNSTNGSGEMSMVRKHVGDAAPLSQDNDKIAYTLYQDSSYATPWGSQNNAKQGLAGTGTEQLYPVYGKVAGDQLNKTAGRYADRVSVEVSY
ncbi:MULTISPECIES: Csu type fimbrial protein [Neisseria]|uniref:Uncharacterized secreted protein n=1 Tax=Neisseria zoodegmatis TaxID=326523 RepID=A0AB38DP26_9NEIS|nr:MULTISPECIES: spore coat protein U domain-containing protein [Neisseria]OSI09936.1 hypothetical protein BWD10_06970 [Neisseria zoodegmatis]OSI14780.1 hypothetical protein BV914_09235 [Neisseria dumasiana]SNU78969.1 Uncharacterized secreted protein [Neisseria zoodegmatis]